MRMKRSRIRPYFIRPRTVEKDSEGSTSETFGTAFLVIGEIWPAGGRVQAEQYGKGLSYIRNAKIDSDYTVETEDGWTIYRLDRTHSVRELDGVCVDVDPASDPDYRIISIKPYKPLTLELERIK